MSMGIAILTAQAATIITIIRIPILRVPTATTIRISESASQRCLGQGDAATARSKPSCLRRR